MLCLVRPVHRALSFLMIVSATTFAQRVEPSRERGVYHAAAFPTKPGVYRHKGWRYDYTVEERGTRSERRVGRLFLDEREVTGARGELLEEFLGRFVYFGTSGYNRNWLNTLTYDRPVFDGAGSLTPAAREAISQKTQ
jgi:hypothetical protein